MENLALSPQRPPRKAMRSASSPLKPLRATMQNQGLLTPQGTLEDMDVDLDSAQTDPAKTLISPPPESQPTPRRAGSVPVERPKRKRAQTSLARVSEDEHSDHGEPPRERRKPRKHPRPSPSVSPTPDMALTRAAMRRAQSSSPGRGYSPPRERFTPPRVVIATPSPTKPNSSSRAHKARPSTLTVKKEPPEIDLSKPAPPPSPSDDPILLRARRRAQKAASEEPTQRKKKDTARHVRRASDEAVESEPAVEKERAQARDYFTPRDVERVDEEEDVLPEQELEYRTPSLEPVYDHPAPPREPSPARAASPEVQAEVPATRASVADTAAPSPYSLLNKLTNAHPSSDESVDEEDREEPALSYTGRFTQTRIPTAADPPTSTTRARRERWGRPVSPFPKSKKYPLGRLPEGEEDEGGVGEVPHFEDDEEEQKEDGEGEEDMELDEHSFAREHISMREEDNPIQPSAPAAATLEEEEEDEMESMYADPPAPTPPRRHAPVARTPALPTRTEPLVQAKTAPLASDTPRSPLLPSRSAGSARSPWLSLTSANAAAGSKDATTQGPSDPGYDSRSPEGIEPTAATSAALSLSATHTQPVASGSGSTSISTSTVPERLTLIMAPPRRVPSPSKQLPPSSPASATGSTASPRPPRRVAVAEKPPVYSPLVARLSSGAPVPSAGLTPRKSAAGGLEGVVKRRGVIELVEQHASTSARGRLWGWDVPVPGEREREVQSTPVTGASSTKVPTFAWDDKSNSSINASTGTEAGPSTSMPPPATPLLMRVELEEPETPTPAFATPTPAPRPITTQAPRAGPSSPTSVSRLAHRFSISPDAPLPGSLKGKEKEVVPGVHVQEMRIAQEKKAVEKPKSILKKLSRASIVEREQDKEDEAIVDVLLTPQRGEGGVRFRQEPEEDEGEDKEEYVAEEEMEGEEDVEVQDAEADSDDGDSSDPGEGDASVIKIVSDDPWQAARAAAILKQHEYDLIPFAPRRRRLDLQTLFKRTNRAMLGSSGISKFKSKSKAKPMRELRGVVLDGTVFTPGSPSPLRTREDLFADANRSLGGHPAPPVDAYRTPSPSLSVSSSVDGRTEIDTAGPRPWARSDWKLLDACITDERMAMATTPGALADVDAMSLPAVIGRFVAFFEHNAQSVELAVESGLERMGSGWTYEEMLARARALLKKHRAGTPAPPTPEGSRRASPVVPDFTPVKLPAPSFEGRKGLGLTVRAAPGIKMPAVLGAPRYAHLLSEARSIAAPPRGQVEVEKVVDESMDTSMDASLDISTNMSVSDDARLTQDGSTSSSSSTGDDSQSQEASTSTSDTSVSSAGGRLPTYLKDAPSPSLGARVKSFFSLSSYLPRTPAPSKPAPNADNSRALPPPPEARERGPIITPISKPAPAPAHPKDLVELDHVPTPAPAAPSRIPIPKRLVDLRHVSPEPEPKIPKKRDGPVLKKRGSVQDLVGLFETVQEQEERRIREDREERFGKGKSGVGKLGLARAWKP